MIDREGNRASRQTDRARGQVGSDSQYDRQGKQTDRKKVRQQTSETGPVSRQTGSQVLGKGTMAGDATTTQKD